MIVTKKGAETIAVQLIEHHLAQADGSEYRWYAGVREVDGLKVETAVVVMSGDDLRQFQGMKASGLRLSLGEPEAPAESVTKVEPDADTLAPTTETEPTGEA